MRVPVTRVGDTLVVALPSFVAEESDVLLIEYWCGDVIVMKDPVRIETEPEPHIRVKAFCDPKKAGLDGFILYIEG